MSTATRTSTHATTRPCLTRRGTGAGGGDSDFLACRCCRSTLRKGSSALERLRITVRAGRAPGLDLRVGGRDLGVERGQGRRMPARLEERALDVGPADVVQRELLGEGRVDGLARDVEQLNAEDLSLD